MIEWKKKYVCWLLFFSENISKLDKETTSILNTPTVPRAMSC